MTALERAALPLREAPRDGVHASPAALVRAARPRQWVKNVLVLAAPVAAGVVSRERVVATAALAFTAFTLAAAGTYLLNDVHDVARDRGHPDKRFRPVASGAVGATTATVTGAVLCVTAPAAAFAADKEELGVVVLAYLVSSLAYTLFLKHVPVLELGLVTTGFVLRPLAGAAATSVPPSGWFLAVCCLGALTVVVGKWSAELARLGAAAGRHRPVLAGYSSRTLRLVRRGAALGTLLCYTGWVATRPAGEPRYAALVTLVLLALAIRRYGRRNDGGAGEAPEDLLVHDRVLLALAACWVVVFAVGVGHV